MIIQEWQHLSPVFKISWGRVIFNRHLRLPISSPLTVLSRQEKKSTKRGFFRIFKRK